MWRWTSLGLALMCVSCAHGPLVEKIAVELTQGAYCIELVQGWGLHRWRVCRVWETGATAGYTEDGMSVGMCPPLP